MMNASDAAVVRPVVLGAGEREAEGVGKRHSPLHCGGSGRPPPGLTGECCKHTSLSPFALSCPFLLFSAAESLERMMKNDDRMMKE
jgi:hypothetical protein